MMKGECFLVRYADDFVMGFHDESDARRVMEVLSRRFAKYGLEIHPEKTRLLRFTRPWQNHNGERSESFDFLGFTHYWEKSRSGSYVVRRKTAQSRFARGLKNVSQWCRENRHRKITEQIRIFSRKLQGHYAYYAIHGNYRSLERFRRRALHIWYRWLCRRTRNWAGISGSFGQFAQKVTSLYRVPTPKILHSDV